MGIYQGSVLVSASNFGGVSSWNDLTDKPFEKTIERTWFGEEFSVTGLVDSGKKTSSGDVIYEFNDSIDGFNNFIDLYFDNLNATKTVVINGVEYSDVQTVGDTWYEGSIGDTELIETPFCYEIIQGDYLGAGTYEHSYKFRTTLSDQELIIKTAYDSQIIKTIDKEFLPNGGQVSWDELNDKPFGDYIHKYDIDVVFDGFVDTGRTNVNGEIIYECTKQSYMPDSFFDFYGEQTISLVVEGEEEPIEINVMKHNNTFAIGDMSCVKYRFYWSCDRVYMGHGFYDYENIRFFTTIKPQSDEVTLKFVVTNREVYKLSREYLDLPFGSNYHNERVIETLLEEQTVIPASTSSKPEIEFSTPNHTVQYGNEYLIYWDGVIYSTKVQYSAPVGWYVGNYYYSAYGGYRDEYNTGEPFYAQVIGEDWLFWVCDGTEFGDEHTICIYYCHEDIIEDITTIDEKYLPETVAKKSDIDEAIASIPVPDVSGQIEAHNTSTNTHADIREMINSIPLFTYGTEDLVAGESELAEGVIYFVYE